LGSAELENGGHYFFKCLGGDRYNSWLEGREDDYSVRLNYQDVDIQEKLNDANLYPGIEWIAYETFEPDVYLFKCMVGDGWLKGDKDGNVILDTQLTGDPGFNWKVYPIEYEENVYLVRCMAHQSNHWYLKSDEQGNVRTADETVDSSSYWRSVYNGITDSSTRWRNR